MELLDLSRALAAHKLLDGMTPAQSALIAGCTRNQRFSDGEYLLREGSDAATFYLVRKGTVALESHVPGRGVFIAETVGEGGLVGLSWMFPPSRNHLDARALGDVLAFAIDGACLRRKMEEDHDLGYAVTRMLLRLVYQRLERARLQRLDVYRAT